MSKNAQDIESTIRIVAISILILSGALFIYKGAEYFVLKKNNPEIHNKIYAAAIFSIVIGIAEIAFGVYLLI